MPASGLQYPVPPFLEAWYATDAYAENEREWFVAQARGMSVRSLDLPIMMPRKLERTFFTSYERRPIERAMRRDHR